MHAIEHSIAADAPMVAAVLAALGQSTVLISNDVGHDLAGAQALVWLEQHGVSTRALRQVDGTTPQIVIVTDKAGTRTWFPHLPDVTAILSAVDLGSLASAAYGYVDCYAVIEPAALRAVALAREHRVPLLINLGGSPLTTAVRQAVQGYPGLLIQTSIDDTAHLDAPRVAVTLQEATGADWVVVTSGVGGSLALSPTERHTAPALAAAIRNTHCAGAAFSGGLLYGVMQGWEMSRSLRLASASGALRCERPHDEPLPALHDLQTAIDGRTTVQLLG